MSAYHEIEIAVYGQVDHPFKMLQTSLNTIDVFPDLL